jgi:acetyl-CoA acetyltransferase family protein
MPEAVIVSTARTPIGRAHRGSLVNLDVFDLAAVAVRAAFERSGVPVSDVDDLVLAESYKGGGVVGRYTALALGMTDVPGLSHNRHCASGLAAVATAAGSVRAGMDRVVLAGGTESMTMRLMTSKVEADGQLTPWSSPPHPEDPDAPAGDMPLAIGENTARLMGLTRRDVDEWAVYTQERAIESIDNGWFDSEIVPVEIRNSDGTARLFSVDEHPRRGTTLEVLGGLKVLHPELPDATVTAGNSAGLNDAAAVVMVTSEDYARANGLPVLARIKSWAAVATEPVRTGLTPIRAIPKALERAGLSLSDVDLFEINEAFCSVPVAAVRELGLDPTRVNVNGSGASLGHPIAATGARMLMTMTHELRRRGASIGCISMCAAGGMGSAMVLEVDS